ncbi:MAG: MFS transporter [Euryarchaeota archaeon]|nr:MFS transporter [Euryarchaeota archaeon]
MADPTPPHGRWLLFLLPFSSVLVLGFGVALVGPTLRGLEGGLEWWQNSLLASAVFLGISGSALAFGRLGERLGFHRVIPLGVAVLAASLALLALGGGGFLPVLLGFLVIGVSFGAIQAAGNPLVPRLFPERPGAALNLLHTAWSIGAFAGPVLAGIYAARGDIQGVFQIGLLLSLGFLGGSMVLVRRFPPAPGDSAPEKRVDLGFPLPLVLLILANFFYAGSEMSINSWLPTYLGAGGAGQAEAGLSLGLFWGLMGLGRVMLGPLLDRFEPRRMLLGHIGLALLLYGASLLLPGMAFLLWPLAGFLYSVMFPGLMVLTSRRFPRRPGAAMGAIFTFGVWGAVVFPALLGGLVARVGAWTVPVVAAGSLGGMGAVILALRERPAT